MVKVLFDTSILIAGFVASHPHHQAALPWLQKAKTKEIEGIIATHTLAETYSVLTRLPVKPIISPSIAQRLIQENLNNFTVIPLSNQDYQIVIEQMVNLNLTGGAIYDALIAQVAINISADKILTLNPKHFKRLGESIATKVEVPQ